MEPSISGRRYGGLDTLADLMDDTRCFKVGRIYSGFVGERIPGGWWQSAAVPQIPSNPGAPLRFAPATRCTSWFAPAALVSALFFGGCSSDELPAEIAAEIAAAEPLDEPGTPTAEQGQAGDGPADQHDPFSLQAGQRSPTSAPEDSLAETSPKPAAGLSPFSDWLGGSPTGPCGWEGSDRVPADEALDHPSPPPGSRPIYPVPSPVMPGFSADEGGTVFP